MLKKGFLLKNIRISCSIKATATKKQIIWSITQLLNKLQLSFKENSTI